MRKILVAITLVVLLVVAITGCTTPAATPEPTPTPDLTPTPDGTAPTVRSTAPGNRSSDIPINRKIIATFSEAMAPSTVITAFSLKQGTTPVPGVVTYVGVTAIFTPATNLSLNSEYTATISTMATDLAGNALAANKVWSFTTSANSDVTLPTVRSTAPGNRSSDIPINRKIIATFSEAMAPSTVITAFSLKQGTTPVPGVVTYVGVTAIFTPATNLSLNSEYTATISTMATDLAGNALAANEVWIFNTSASADVTAHTVNSTVPIDRSSDVPINRKIIATFSEAMDPLTVINAFTLKQGTTFVSNVTTYVGVTAILTPTAKLTPNTEYTATITTRAKDLAGNPLAANKVWTFTTGVTADVMAPTLSSTIPENHSSGIPVNSKIVATFSEAMNPLTVNTATFSIKQGDLPVAGTVTHVGVTATFASAANFEPNTEYTATITARAKDLAGNALAIDNIWTFTTGAISDVTTLNE